MFHPDPDLQFRWATVGYCAAAFIAAAFAFIATLLGAGWTAVVAPAAALLVLLPFLIVVQGRRHLLADAVDGYSFWESGNRPGAFGIAAGIGVITAAVRCADLDAPLLCTFGALAVGAAFAVAIIAVAEFLYEARVSLHAAVRGLTDDGRPDRPAKVDSSTNDCEIFDYERLGPWQPDTQSADLPQPTDEWHADSITPAAQQRAAPQTADTEPTPAGQQPTVKQPTVSPRSFTKNAKRRGRRRR
jgi:hypothetical protein